MLGSLPPKRIGTEGPQSPLQHGQPPHVGMDLSDFREDLGMAG